MGDGDGVKGMERKGGSQSEKSEEESSRALMLNTRSDNRPWGIPEGGRRSYKWLTRPLQ